MPNPIVDIRQAAAITNNGLRHRGVTEEELAISNFLSKNLLALKSISSYLSSAVMFRCSTSSHLKIGYVR